MRGLRSRLCRRRRRRDEGGYVAIMSVLLFTVVFGFAAFAVDVGMWYVTGHQEQRAADAAALGGVPFLPGAQGKAFSAAQKLSTANDYQNGVQTVEVVTGIDGSPTRLRVTVTKTVDNVFGGLFGISKTTITRTAVADYAGPVPMGSPCNEYGNDPESGGIRSGSCSDTGQFWANVGSPAAPKGNGDAYQNNSCASGNDGCPSSTNIDYDPNGYFYSVTLTKPVQNLTFQAFDPALIDVGDLCTDNNLNAAKSLHPANHSSSPEAMVNDPGARYENGQSSPYCTGDISYNAKGGKFTTQVATSFTVRDPGPNPWDPLSFPVRAGCTQTYPGYSGDLSLALNRKTADYKVDTPGFGPGYVAQVFRQWKTLCTIANAPAGTYMIQIKTNGLGADGAGGHNRFGLRAYSTSDSSAKDAIAVSGYQKMAMYANLPDANTKFYLARVPSGAAGQLLNVRLWDVGDSTQAGTIRVLAPDDSGVTFTSCTGVGPRSGSLPNCELTSVDGAFNGRWQEIRVPIPKNYKCNDLDPNKCWVKLLFAYGSGNQPSDTTSWTASIEGDPVRLVE